MKKLRIGFAGIGAMGLSHLKAMHVDQGGRAEAVAIGSRNTANIDRAHELAPNARVFADDRALIRSDLDGVFISTPNGLHARLALETLRAGRHLFLEKPVGITRAECRQVLAAAAQTDRVVMVGHELRYAPVFQRIKTLVDAGEIGQPRLVWTREFRGPFQKKSGNWLQDNRWSGGALVDKSCHHFDLMNWWVGSRPRRVCAFGGQAGQGEVRSSQFEGQRPKARVGLPPSAFRVRAPVLDHATVSFEYENGMRGTLQLCLFARDFPDEELEMGIVGDRGELRTKIVRPEPAGRPADEPSRSRRLATGFRTVREGVGLEILQWRRGVSQPGPIVHTIKTGRGDGWGGHAGFAEIHEAFLRAIRQEERPLTAVADCVDGTLLAIAAEESIRRGGAVEV
ncbi:MAG: Gfo/Idh/MocA family oxidoreductase [Verrucomicrobia bacterium]|nr:Gfo/Idh/MocA family oxidoreductase [Verrucomicrobiota bacterium]